MSLEQHSISDALKSYDGPEGEYVHEVIDHAIEYVRGNVHTNGLENFWSLLKRGINGTYVSAEPFHLFRYVDEQAFRYNTKLPVSDADRFDLLVRKVSGKHLMYAELIDKEGKQPKAAN
ncbi:MAG TPA: transposase [Terriglobia bacterium]|nr:transposase [Terriglobia bacterium]